MPKEFLTEKTLANESLVKEPFAKDSLVKESWPGILAKDLAKLDSQRTLGLLGVTKVAKEFLARDFLANQETLGYDVLGQETFGHSMIP